MLKIALKKLITKLRLNKLADDLRMRFYQMRNLRKNRAFASTHPTIVLPPDVIMYETFRLDYEKYYTSGQETAQWIIQLYQTQTNQIPGSILDWGCGPARVIRHMPNLLGPGARICGSDFNSTTIDWCRKHISNVDFLINGLDPPIAAKNGKFDCIYAISVFTHLSLARHHSWILEVHRLLSEDGIFIFTSQGDIFKSLLQNEELRDYEDGKLVTRDHRMEGRRIFSAFHPPLYIKSLLQGFQVLEHQPGGVKNHNPQQDVWIVKKK